MGGAASKQGVKRATAAAATATKPSPAAAAAVEAPRVIPVDMSRAEVVKAAVTPARPSMEDAVRNPNAAPELIEMNQQLLEEMKRFQDFDKVEYLETDFAAFKKTASSYRIRSNEPITLPTDRTRNAASGTFLEDLPGRLSNNDMRQILRLHYEDPVTWTAELLADRYEVQASQIRSMISNVGPPNVLKPIGPSEHPLGIWFESPTVAAAALASGESVFEQPASSSSSSEELPSSSS
ncbi:hypothetical protein Poli38472_011826 [Pythium oligandrum]|uniref:Uncharacterized protein n=1 Tax=Pythium oligandrum TaxID=41045 RepID=A0A8K1C8P1_PYTOL|nr:hypothetical protein Poli38472_011826 [Pythium oligandrum]|eukprot:TMW58238.1 hypothetical protein Poli38472_011826 [Pythium oligandrum]